MRYAASASEPLQTSASPVGGITEIVLPDSQSSSIYLPSLAFLSSQTSGRWLTWLVPRCMDRTKLMQYGFDLKRTRFIYPASQEDCFQLIWKALAEGNSHTVVGSPGRLPENLLNKLENAARAGRCNGLLLRYRESGSGTA
ncbi:MAG: SulA-like leucine-rich domain-containing protein [Cellvibrionaceae bacterium]|nr:SulA-like leucine-rich domain-containing protein [Cellvibrionaceae bacterium]